MPQGSYAVLNDSQLQAMIHHFLDKLCEMQPKLRPVVQAQKEELTLLMKAVLRPRQLTVANVKREAVMQEVTLALAVTMHAKLQAEQLASSKMTAQPFEELLANFSAMLQNTPLLKQNPKAMEQLLLQLQKNPQLLSTILTQAQMKTLQHSMMMASTQLLPQQKLEPKPNSKQKSQQEDHYRNLLGLITSSEAGGLPIVIQQYLGNGLGIVDFNPNDGMAPLDLVNKMRHTATNPAEVTNTLATSLDVNLNALNQTMQEAACAIANRPQLNRG